MNSEKCKLIYGDRNQIAGCLGTGVGSERGREGGITTGDKETFGANRYFTVVNGVMVSWIYTYLSIYMHVKTYQAVHLNTKLNLLSVKTPEHLMDQVRMDKEGDGGTSLVLLPKEMCSTFYIFSLLFPKIVPY